MRLDRLTVKAQEAIAAAQGEASRCGHAGFGPLHLLDALLKQAVDEFGISARAYTRILKVGRTVADLDCSEKIGVEHIAEAVQYRMSHSNIWE